MYSQNREESICVVEYDLGPKVMAKLNSVESYNHLYEQYYLDTLDIHNVLTTDWKPYMKNLMALSNLTLVQGQGQIEH